MCNKKKKRVAIGKIVASSNDIRNSILNRLDFYLVYDDSNFAKRTITQIVETRVPMTIAR